MKKFLIVSAATVALATAAFGQGSILVDNSSTAGGFVDFASVGGSPSGHAYYDGTIGLEIWVKSGSTANQSIINTINAGSNLDAYAALTANGFTLQKTYTGVTVSGGGVSLGALQMPSILGNVTLALAAWEGTGATFGSGRSGVLSFIQPTKDYVNNPASGTPDLSYATAGFNSTDLVMAPVPEPGSFALLGLGAAAMMIFRRRK